MTEPSFDMTPALERAAAEAKPGVFAIYGTLHRDASEPILGWGIELPGGGAVFRLLDAGSSVHTADSAQQVLKTHQLIGDVRLKWLDC